MSDLISRAAALKVISAVKGITWSQSGKVLCGKMFSQIKDLPAVDAAPVEWLREKANGNDFVIGRAARFILHALQKEQEAR